MCEESMIARMRLVGAAVVVVAFCGGCRDSSTPAAPPAASDDTGRATGANQFASHGQTPSPSTASVTFHVKDMGKRLNLL